MVVPWPFPPATAWAEGAQINGRPFPATASAEGAQLNAPPSLGDLSVQKGTRSTGWKVKRAKQKKLSPLTSSLFRLYWNHGNERCTHCPHCSGARNPLGRVPVAGRNWPGGPACGQDWGALGPRPCNAVVSPKGIGARRLGDNPAREALYLLFG